MTRLLEGAISTLAKAESRSRKGGQTTDFLGDKMTFSNSDVHSSLLLLLADFIMVKDSWPS